MCTPTNGTWRKRSDRCAHCFIWIWNIWDRWDVYVAMANQKVSTKFYLQDEETIDFLAAHIDKLDASLAKRGYQMHSELIQKEHPEKETAVIEEILKENRNVMSTGVAAYSFDMKA